jgi:uncharacterized protein YegL
MTDNRDVLNHFFPPRPPAETPEEKQAVADANALPSHKNADELVVIVDRSGSMQSIREDAEGGVNAFIEDQRKEPGAANLTLATFDNKYEVVFERAPIEAVPKFVLRPRGGTALLDAIGMTMNTYRDVNTTGKRIAVIMTDGQENASREWTKDSVQSLIEEMKAEGWEFVFLAADETAINDAVSWGFDRDASIQIDRNFEGTSTVAYSAVNEYTKSLRGGATKTAATAAMDATLMDAQGVKKANWTDKS